MPKYKVTYDREGCISAAACVQVNPKHWQLDAGDGRANLERATKNPDTGLFELIIDEEELQKMKEAAEVCPVLIIHIYNLDTGEQVF